MTSTKELPCPTNTYYSASSPVKVEKVPVLEPGFVCRFEFYLETKKYLIFLFSGSAHKDFLIERDFWATNWQPILGASEYVVPIALMSHSYTQCVVHTLSSYWLLVYMETKTDLMLYKEVKHVLYWLAHAWIFHNQMFQHN